MQLARLSDFGVAISVTPVSWAEYASLARETRRPIPRHSGRPTDPVTSVSATDANAFAQWLSRREEQSYRLPCLAEMVALAELAQSGLHVWPG
jgi:formylglycine-generating enzyme required for sulfatase activity